MNKVLGVILWCNPKQGDVKMSEQKHKRIKVKEETHERFVKFAKFHDEKHDKLLNKMMDHFTNK